ncbi:MAG: hypothetical protein M3042_12975 [Actinomycetota bacterium]|nr:hypothetical protein [Actinomycetota bacterium]
MNGKLVLVASAVALTAATAGCGSLGRAPAASTATSRLTSAGAPAGAVVAAGPAAVTRPGVPHFNTPESTAREFASAWNSRDVAMVGHLTNSQARHDLNAMHSEATNLRLNGCVSSGSGVYLCFFDHDYPAASHAAHGSVGHTEIEVAPVSRTGWYVASLVSCG